MLRFLSRMRMLILPFALLGVLTVVVVPASVHAGPPGGAQNCNPGDPGCVEVCGQGSSADACNTFIENYINPAIYALSALVGVVAIISFILAGIQYAASADDPGTVTKAKQRMFNTVLGLVAYIFLFAFLNYLIPGGLF